MPRPIDASSRRLAQLIMGAIGCTTVFIFLVGMTVMSLFLFNAERTTLLAYFALAFGIPAVWFAISIGRIIDADRAAGVHVCGPHCESRESAALDAIRAGPKCPHGDPGGASPHPLSGQPVYPLCRRSARRTSTEETHDHHRS